MGTLYHLVHSARPACDALISVAPYTQIWTSKHGWRRVAGRAVRARKSDSEGRTRSEITPYGRMLLFT